MLCKREETEWRSGGLWNANQTELIVICFECDATYKTPHASQIRFCFRNSIYWGIIIRAQHKAGSA